MSRGDFAAHHFYSVGRRVLLDDDDGVEGALIVLDGVDVFRVCAPGAVDDELVLVLAGDELDRGGVDAVLGLVSHLLGSGIPLVEITGEVDGLALFGVNRERDRFGGRLGGSLLGYGLFNLLGDNLLAGAFLSCNFHFSCSFTFVPAMYLISSERAYSISLFFVKSMFFI